MVRRGALTLGSSGLIHRAAWPGKKPSFALRVRGGVGAYARSLFAALRAAESAGVKTVYVETVADDGVGHAIMDRLRRACRR